MQYTQSELKDLIATVEKEFTAHLNKAEEAHKATLAKSEGANGSAASAPLAKAEDSAPPKKDEKKEEKPSESKEAAPEKKDDAAPKADAKADEKPAEGKDAAPAAPAAEGAAAAPAQEESHGYDDEDLEHMHKMYASMSKAERKAHHDCIMKIAQGEQSAAAPAGEAQAAPAMDKSELPKTNEEANGGQMSANPPKGSPGAKSPASTDQGNLTDMEKSEKTELDLVKAELEAEKAKGQELKKNFDAVSEFLTKFVSKIQAPKGKAITEVATIAKSEGGAEGAAELSKSEITQVLMKKAQDPNLSKADRQAINDFYLNGSNVNTISHLLKN